MFFNFPLCYSVTNLKSYEREDAEGELYGRIYSNWSYLPAADAPGETKRVSILIAAKELAYYNTEERTWSVEAADYVAYIGKSSAAADLLCVGFQIVEAENM